MNLQRLLATLLLSFSLFTAHAYNKVSIYVVAHPDDWQLFMGEEAYDDIQDSTNKVIFIITTSGDASYTRKQANMPFAKARENGVLNSVRFCSDMKTEVDSTCKTKNYDINNHHILHYPYKNVKCYFMRIPDGCFKTGFAGQSLEYLHEGKINAISAIDSSETYTGWNDIVQTMRAIFKREIGNHTDVTLSFQDNDEKYNPGDHPDHRYSGLAALQAAEYFPSMKRIAYVDYDVQYRPINLAPEDIAIKAGIFAIADFGITEFRQGTSFDPGHIAFVMRSYSRVLARIDTATTSPAGGPRIMAYPNPAKSSTTLNFPLDNDETVSVLLYDIKGSIVWEKQDIIGKKGSNTITIPLQYMASGSYFIKLQTSSEPETIKIIKE